MNWRYPNKAFIDGEFTEPLLGSKAPRTDFGNEVFIKLNKGFRRAVLFGGNALMMITNIDDCVKSYYTDTHGVIEYKTFKNTEYPDLILSEIISNYRVADFTMTSTLIFYGFMEDNFDKMYDGDIILINKLMALLEIQCRYYIDMVSESESVINGFAKRAEH